MIKISELEEIARARLADAKVLLTASRFDGTVYTAGYVVELALKARICETLNWTDGFPETGGEFRGFSNLKTHDLNVLLAFSGVEADIRYHHIKEWGILIAWKPDIRYRRIGSTSQADAGLFVEAAEILLEVLI